MGFVHPTPSAEELDSIYRQGYAYHGDHGTRHFREARSPKLLAARWRCAGVVEPRFGDRVRRLAGIAIETLTRKTATFTLGVPLLLPRTAAMLDFGYGTGLWLETMRLRGYRHLWGLDLATNRSTADRLRGHGVQVASGFEDLVPDSLDLIRLEHVFEHLPSPILTLSRLRETLKPGGLLVMTFPSIYPWAAMPDLRASSFLGYLQLPIHVVHHSLESAMEFLDEAGFEVLSTRTTRGERFLTLLARRPKEPQ